MTVNALKLAGPEARPEAAPPDAFRHVMRELASGVALVTTAVERTRIGCAVTSVTSLSLAPASLLVCLNTDSSTLRAIRASGVFAVNLLGGDHAALAQRFAARDIHGADRFLHGDWATLSTGSPTLADALGVIDCRLERVMEHATHAILIGAAVAVTQGAPAPALVHWRSRFEALS